MIGIDSGRHPGNSDTLSAGPFYTLPKALTDVFQPHMPPAAFAIYAVLARRNNLTANPNNSMRELATAANLSLATVLRSIETLVRLGLVEKIQRGGSQANEYRLANVREVAEKWGAVYEKHTVSFSLSPENAKRLRGAITTQKTNQRGQGGAPATPPGVSPLVRQRSHGKRQRTTRETQTGTHLIREERRIEEGPTPTPTPNDGGDAEQPKDPPDEDEPDPPLKMARTIFTGPMNDLRAYLFDTSRPPAPHLANGAADWRDFCFDSLAVERARWRGKTMELVLRASDPDAARRGLEKYQRRWNESLRKWYECEVEVFLVKAERQGRHGC